MALIAAHLNAGIIPVVTVSRYVYNLPLPPPPYPPPPFSPSLISLMACVDVKHHVYLLTSLVLWTMLLIHGAYNRVDTVKHCSHDMKL